MLNCAFKEAHPHSSEEENRTRNRSSRAFINTKNVNMVLYLFMASMIFFMVSEYRVVNAKGPLLFFDPKHDRTASLPVRADSNLLMSHASPCTTLRFACLNGEEGLLLV
jgi:hypothetical protein